MAELTTEQNSSGTLADSAVRRHAGEMCHSALGLCYLTMTRTHKGTKTGKMWDLFTPSIRSIGPRWRFRVSLDNSRFWHSPVICNLDVSLFHFLISLASLLRWHSYCHGLISKVKTVALIWRRSRNVHHHAVTQLKLAAPNQWRKDINTKYGTQKCE